MAGLGAFMQGAMKGYAFAEDAKDAKERRKRRKDDWKWQDESRARLREEWDWQDEQRGRQRDQWRRDDEERSVLAAIGQDAYDSYEKMSESGPQVAVDTDGASNTVSTKGESSRGVMDALPKDAPVVGDRPPENFGKGVRGEDLPHPDYKTYGGGNQPDIQAQRRPDPSSLGTVARDMQPNRQGNPPQPVKQTTRFSDWATSMNLAPALQETARLADLAEHALATGVHPETGKPLTQDEQATLVDEIGIAEHHLRRQAQAAQPHVSPAPLPPREVFPREADDLPAAAKYRMQQAAHAFQAAPQPRPNISPATTRGLQETSADMQSAAASMGSNQLGAGDTNLTRARPVAPAPTRQPVPVAPSSPAPAQMTPAMPLARTPATSQQEPAQPQQARPAVTPKAQMDADIKTVASAPPDQGGSLAVAVAADTAPTKGRGVLGKDDPVKTTNAQREKAAGAFLDHYAETAVPKIVEYYAKTGNIQKAEAFETWANARETKQQLSSWAKAVHSASIGDEKAFLDHLADTYNAFDDGYEVDRTKSDFVRDEGGNITGGIVTFKNTKTGEIFQKTYDSQEDIIREAIHAMSPEQVFEHLWGQMAQASEIAAEQRKFERDVMLEQIKSGNKAPTNNTKLVSQAKNDLADVYGYKEAPNGKTWSQMTPDEQDQLAVEHIRRNQKAGASINQPDAPPLYTGE